MNGHVSHSVLGVPGHFFAVGADVVPSVGLGVDAKLTENCHHRLKIAAEVYIPVSVGNEGVLNTAAVLIDGAAARQPAHDVDAAGLGVGHVHFLMDVLEISHHDGRTWLPQHENLVAERLYRGKIVFSRKIHADVGG